MAVQAYGLTEDGIVNTFNESESTFYASVGMLLPSFEAKIVEVDKRWLFHQINVENFL